MKYRICIFRVSKYDEEFITKYELDTMPYIPHRNETLLVEGYCFRVVNVSTSFDIVNEVQEIEIAVKDIPTEYYWWEV